MLPEDPDIGGQQEGTSLSSQIDKKSEGFIRETSVQQKREKTRGRITKAVVYFYLTAILGLLLCSVVAIAKGNALALGQLDDLTDSLHDLILPLMMLILGFYFGNQSKND